MLSPVRPTGVRSEEPPLIAMINQHRDEVAIDLEAANLDPDDRVLFPILVAIARLAAKADFASQEAAQSI